MNDKLTPAQNKIVALLAKGYRPKRHLRFPRNISRKPQLSSVQHSKSSHEHNTAEILRATTTW